MIFHTYHYVYLIRQKGTGLFYIGYSSTALPDPLQALGVTYFTSGSLRAAFEANPHTFTREILFTSFFDREAYVMEQQLIRGVFGMAKNVNWAYDREAAPGKAAKKHKKAKARRKVKPASKATQAKHQARYEEACRIEADRRARRKR